MRAGWSTGLRARLLLAPTPALQTHRRPDRGRDDGVEVLLGQASYVEFDSEDGRVTYVEHHRTLGDRVGSLAGAGFANDTPLEPEWPTGHDRVWGGWSAVRGKYMPGTAIFGCHLVDR